MRRSVRIPVTLLALCLAGCGDDERDVGGSCSRNGDCTERCLTGGDFPGGFCTLPCSDHRDCPDNAYCVDRQGGVCLFDCSSDAECASELDDSYECHRERARSGRDGRVLVCIGD